MCACPACPASILLKHLKAQDVGGPIILITGHGDVDMAVAAIKVGAFDFIEKPFDEARLLASIRNAVGRGRQRESDASELEKLQSRFNTLSTRQRQVMELAVSGLIEQGNRHRSSISARRPSRTIAPG